MVHKNNMYAHADIIGKNPLNFCKFKFFVTHGFKIFNIQIMIIYLTFSLD